eukprot:3787199-Pyramimonas_sp.AAC.1
MAFMIPSETGVVTTNFEKWCFTYFIAPIARATDNNTQQKMMDILAEGEKHMLNQPSDTDEAIVNSISEV